jgi:hypothetical protein
MTMNQVQLQIRDRGAIRSVPCGLCGEPHDQQFIAVTLFVDDRPSGDLCPRCLKASPAAALLRLLQHRRRLSERSRALQDRSVLLLRRAQQMHESVSRLPAERTEYREDGRLPAEKAATTAEAAARAAQEEAERLRSDAAALVNLGNWVRELATWPVTLAQVWEAEKTAIRERFPEFEDDDVAALVNARYWRLSNLPPSEAIQEND